MAEAGIKVPEDNDWSEQRAATAGQGIVRMLVCCENMLKEKKRSVTPYNSVFYFSKAYPETRALPPCVVEY